MTIKSRLWVFVWSCVLAGFLTEGSIQAQTTSGTISGVVRDSQQAVIPGATVTVRSAATGATRRAVTNENGRYRFPQLTPGIYEVEAEMSGFRTENRTGISLSVAADAVVNFALTVSSVAETIEVVGEAPLVETTSSNVSSLVNEQAMQDLPINGRSFIELARLQEGVNPVRTVSAGAANSFGQHLSVGGANPENNNFMMDGTNISTYQGLGHGGVGGTMPGVEAVKEFRVLTHQFSAEFGRGTGAVINAVSKSGTNAFHGSVYEYLRNDNLDAAQWKDPVKQEFKRNQFGASVGGPIFRDRTFFFANYEGLEERLGVISRPAVPTAAARSGILPSGTVTVDPAVRPALNLFPLPTPGEIDNGDGSAQYLQAVTVPTSKTYLIGRIDHSFTPEHWMFARYTYDTGSVKEPGFPANLFVEKAHTPLRYATVELNSTLTPTILNTFRFGVTKTPTTSSNIDPPETLHPSLFLVPGFRIASYNVSGLEAVGPNDALLHIRDFGSLEWADAISLSTGNHAIKSGFTIQRIIQNPTIQTRMGGRWTIDSIREFLTNDDTSSVQFAPAALASPDRRYRQTLFGFFFQDDYQMRPDLTLNLGLRYEFVTVLREIDGKFPRLPDDQLFTVTREGIIVDEPGYLRNPDLKNFEPRIGIAWDPFGQGRTSVRAGLGVYHDHIYLSSLAHEFARMHPHNVFNVDDISYAGTTAAEIVAKVRPPAIGNTAIVLPNNPSSMYSVHWTLDIQHQLTPTTVASIGYRGSRTVHIMGMQNYTNAIPINFSTKADNEPWLFANRPQRANRDFNTITYKDTGNDASYNALSFRAEKRFSSGLQFQARYTFAKAIDNTSTQKGGGNVGGSNIGVTTKMAWYDKDVDKSVSSFDLTHNFTVNASYRLPVGNNLQGFARQIMGGWNISGILSRSSGPPLNLGQGTSGARGTNIIGGSRRPDWANGRDAEDTVLGGPDLYYDPAAFTFAPNNRWGFVGRNVLRSPGFFNVDFALNKDWRVAAVSEQAVLQFRWELYNLTNHPNLSPPDTTLFNGNGVAQGSAGRIDDTLSTMRQMSFALKFLF